jgi:hypothetical protein
MKKLLRPVALFLLTASIAQAQDFKNILKEMREEYTRSATLRVAIELVVYDSAENVPFYKQGMIVTRSGDNYRYEMEENEMLLNDKYLIMVDNASKQISFTHRNKAAEQEMQKALQFNPDSVLALYESFQYVGRADGAEHFYVKEKRGPIDEVHFYIMMETRKLTGMAYKYHGGQYASIRFHAFEKDVVFGADTFSESRYVTMVNKKMMPSPSYRQYKISYQ